MPTLLAFAPLCLILYLMAGRRWPTYQSALLGYLVTLVIAVLGFGANFRVMWVAHARGVLLSLDVLWIIWSAYIFYRILDEAGMVKVIGQALPGLTDDRGLQALAIGWVFSTFLQGMGGFGVPVAITAPLLTSLGFTPLQSVLIPSIGHGWAVTYGSLGSAFQALLTASSMDYPALAGASALLLAAAGLAGGLLAAHVTSGWSGLRRLIIPIILLGLGMGFTQYAVAVSGLWNIAAVSAGLAGLALLIPIAWVWNRLRRSAFQVVHHKALAQALVGYALLIGVAWLAQIPAIKDALSSPVLQLHYPATATEHGYFLPASETRALPVLRHSGTLLLYAGLLAAAFYVRLGVYKPGTGRRILDSTWRGLWRTSLGVWMMVTLAAVMEQSGMTAALASGLAAWMGPLFPLASPSIGAIGAFMTGSNTNSNVMFAGLQKHTAQVLGYPAALILAGQTAGGAVGSVLAPAKIMVGVSTAGLVGQEGEVLRHLLIYISLQIVLLSLLTWLVVYATG